MGIQVYSDISHDAHLHLLVVPGMLMSTTYIQTIVQPVLLPFLDQIGDPLFQQDNAHLHLACEAQRAQQTIPQCLWHTYSSDFFLIKCAQLPAVTIAQWHLQVIGAWNDIP